MPKKLSDTQGSSSAGYPGGVFIDVCKVKDVKDKSNYPTKAGAPKQTIGKNGFEPELCLQLEVETGSFTKTMYLFGNFDYKKDKISGKDVYQGWRSKGNAVQSFLVRLLGDDAVIGDDDTIYEATLDKLKGKEFYKLRYCTGPFEHKGEVKPSFNDYQRVQSANDENNMDTLYKEFLKSSSFLKDYDPHYFDKWSDASKDADTRFDPDELSTEDPI